MTTRICWADPAPGIDNEGNERTTQILSSCTVEDAIMLSRKSAKDAGSDPSKFTPKQLLEDFIICNWAWVEDNGRKAENFRVADIIAQMEEP